MSDMNIDDPIIERWIQEQYDVASQVIVLPDPEPLPLVFNPHQRTTADHSPRFVDILMDDQSTIGSNGNINNNNNNKKESELTNRDTSSESPIYYGGVDVSFPEPDSGTSAGEDHHDNNDEAVAVYVIMEYPSMSIVYQQYMYFQLTIPYIPSFLAFREIEPVQQLIQEQQATHPQYTPAAILVDGNGIFHPRHAGLACFVGVRTGIPTIGIGKTLLCDPDGATGRTKDNVHRTIQQSIRDCCRNDGRTGPTPPLPQQQQITNNHSESLEWKHPSSVVTFDCHVDPPPPSSNDNDPSRTATITLDDRAVLMAELSQQCSGLAIPIGGIVPRRLCQRDNSSHHQYHNCSTVTAVDEDSTVAFDVLAYAVVGHGGRIRHRSRSPGTSQPIYISVGHGISRQEAVRVGARLSYSRIPEPVRQADLYGRALWRERRKKAPLQTGIE